MKKILLFACAALVALASCSKDDPGKTPPVTLPGEKVDFALGVGSDSRFDINTGGLGNVSKDLYSMRYILEVYTEADEAFVGRYERFSDIGEDGVGTGTLFNLKLDMNEYRFVIWGDFVPKTEASLDGVDEPVDAAAAIDNLYITTNGLRQVAIDMDKYSDVSFHPIAVEDVDGGTQITRDGRMLRDAYCASKTVSLFEASVDAILLKRPLTRIELRTATAFDETPEAAGVVAPASITTEYTDGFYSAYDVYAQDVVAASLQAAPVSYNIEVVEAPVITQFQIDAVPMWRYEQLAAFDYVFAPAVQPGDPDPIWGKISFNNTLLDSNSDEIAPRFPLEFVDQDLKANQRFMVTELFIGLPPLAPEP